MDETKMNIHLQVGGERFLLNDIRREDEQLYRDAAKQINDKLNKYGEMCRTLAISPARYMAMVALELAFENVSMKDRNDTAPYREKLAELTREMEKYIGDGE